jgi:hypothetical protein
MREGFGLGHRERKNPEKYRRSGGKSIGRGERGSISNYKSIGAACAMRFWFQNAAIGRE